MRLHFFALMLLIGFNINCQTVEPGMTDSALIFGSGERVRLFTDRNMYCVNENIYFTATYSCNSKVDSIIWSKVLYVELIRWNGEKLANLKLKLDGTGSSGSLQIPGDLLSGNYYLRAYTKWMRNFSAYNYDYRLIKIANPFKAMTDGGPAEIPDSSKSSLTLSSSKKIIQGVECVIKKSQYQPREKVEVEIYISDNKTVACNNFCVSIAKAGSIDTSFPILKPELEPCDVKWGDIEYLPEIWGITISGKVMDKTSGTPKKNHLINLSETANGEFFSIYRTRDNGRFTFSLPDLYGKYDFFIQSESSDTGLSEFLIDNDFCNRTVLLPYIAFSLSDDEKILIRDMMVNMQLNEKFRPNPDTIKNHSNNHHQPAAFYGSGKHIYYTKKYIELPNIEEFFNEIVVEANVIQNKKTSELKISGNTGFSNYPPLILLDNIQVCNDDRLLKLPLDKIERVEAIASAYVVGEMKYSGLLSIYSKNKDFAGIDLNKNNIFFAFNLFTNETSEFNLVEFPGNSRIPDRRNLLYWNPDIQLLPGKNYTVSFHTADNKGKFAVFILGKNSGNDTVVFGQTSFSVE